jgi:hypothetical protein
MRCIGYHKSHDNSQLSCILLGSIFDCVICLTSDLEELLGSIEVPSSA